MPFTQLANRHRTKPSGRAGLPLRAMYVGTHATECAGVGVLFLTDAALGIAARFVPTANAMALALPIKTLEDPEGALAATESLHAYARSDFAKDYPKFAG